MPGDTSLKYSEYYAHSRNRFWKIIATITNAEIPNTYEQKKDLLRKNKIGLWDVAARANRKGSLDTSMSNEIPNDLENFINMHKHLRVIALNGAKADTLFNNFFSRKPNITYFSLPSTSPANTRYNFEVICSSWKQILT